MMPEDIDRERERKTKLLGSRVGVVLVAIYFLSHMKN
jgi:hypothetical protein